MRFFLLAGVFTFFCLLPATKALVFDSCTIDAYAGQAASLGSSGMGGQATSAQIGVSLGLFMKPGNELMITDNGNGNVWRVPIATKVIENYVAINQPYGICGDSTGTIYPTTGTNGEVKMVATNGVVSRFAGSYGDAFSGDGGQATSAKFKNPTRCSVDSNADVYIADFDNYRIRKVTKSSGIITTYAGSGLTTPDGQVGALTSTTINQPMSMFIDTAGSLFVGTMYQGRVLKTVLGSGQVTIYAGFVGAGSDSFSGDGGPATSAGFSSPFLNMGFDKNGNMYVANNGGFRVRLVRKDTKIVTTIAGTGSTGTTGDGGPALSAKLSNTLAIVTLEENVYILDGSRVRIMACNLVTPSTIVPSAQPTVTPSAIPSPVPTITPSVVPSLVPTALPSVMPTQVPSAVPSSVPTAIPSVIPSQLPSAIPSVEPSQVPTAVPTVQPSAVPSVLPSHTPTAIPSVTPSETPSVVPTEVPTAIPTQTPTQTPTASPTELPSEIPSVVPSAVPSTTPSLVPSEVPTFEPSQLPSQTPSATPSATPSITPSVVPSASPSISPSAQPSILPTITPSVVPSALPSVTPTAQPTAIPTGEPTNTPTQLPTVLPSVEPTAEPSAIPTITPSAQPTATPSEVPSLEPSVVPSAMPSVKPSRTPSHAPSVRPSKIPTAKPSLKPTPQPTVEFKGVEVGANVTIENVHIEQDSGGRRRLARAGSMVLMEASDNAIVKTVAEALGLSEEAVTIESEHIVSNVTNIATVLVELRILAPSNVFPTFADVEQAFSDAIAFNALGEYLVTVAEDIGAYELYQITAVNIDALVNEGAVDTSESEDDDGVSRGEYAGIIISAVFIVLVAVLAVWWCVFSSHTAGNAAETNAFHAESSAV